MPARCPLPSDHPITLTGEKGASLRPGAQRALALRRRA
jgi:hypothetical protein